MYFALIFRIRLTLYAVAASSLDWNNMILETKVNGQVRQSQNTKDLIFDIPTLIEVRNLVPSSQCGGRTDDLRLLQTVSMGITLMVSPSHVI
jgi:hypothetical protein